MAPRRIIAITGASAGIGRATAVRLARDMAELVRLTLNGYRRLDVMICDVMSRETGARVPRNHGPRQSADQVANAIARAIAHPVPELSPYAKSRGLVWLNALAPGLCDRFVKRYGRKPITGLD